MAGGGAPRVGTDKQHDGVGLGDAIEQRAPGVLVAGGTRLERDGMHVGLADGDTDRAATPASTGGQAAPDTVRTTAALPRRTTRQVLDMASPTPGGPDHWMLYDGMLLLHVVVAPGPDDIRHPAAGDPRAELAAAVRRGALYEGGWFVTRSG